MRLFSLLALPLIACATAPVELEAIKQAVDSRASYAYYTGWDKRLLSEGNSGNCAAFAHTYQQEALAREIPLSVTACKLTGGQTHAFAMTYDRKWALDIRHKFVVPLDSVGCE